MMTAVTTDLAEFLLARIAENEATARPRYVRNWTPENGWKDNPEGQMPGDRRRMAEYEAMRRVVERVAMPDPHRPDEGCADCEVLYLLALPYADHPDYREEWRP